MGRPIKKERGIYFRKNADGKIVWYCRVYFSGREQREGPFETKTEARNKRDDLRSQHRMGKMDPEGGWQLLDDLIDRHLKLRADKQDQSSQKRFSRWWRERFKPKDIKRVKDLTIRVLEEARQDLKAEIIKVGPELPPVVLEGKKAGRKIHKQVEGLGKHREPGTINRYFVWLQSMLKPVRHKRMELFGDWEWEREPKGRTRHLSPKEEAILKEALGPIYGTWARFAIMTGLRQAEQFNLEWRNVDLEKGILTLSKTKSGNVQYHQMNSQAQAILRGFDSWQRSKWVFPSENPAFPVDPRNFYHRVWIPAVKRAGIEWATWHDLRHTYASRLAMSGHNDSTIAALLRHSGVALVQRYAHLNQEHLRQAVESVARFGMESVSVSSVVQAGEKTGTKPETHGSVGERNGQPKAAEVGVVEGEKIGAPDTN